MHGSLARRPDDEDLRVCRRLRPANPCECPIDAPPLWQDVEPGLILLGGINWSEAGILHDRFLIGTVAADCLDERPPGHRPIKHQPGTVTVLDLGRMNLGLEGQAQRIDQDVALAPLTFLLAWYPTMPRAFGPVLTD